MASLRNRARTRFVVVPPAHLPAPDVFRNVASDPQRHDRLVAEMQRFRGMVYSRDGAVSTSELKSDGRHKLAVDEQSWHVLSLDRDDRICACLRYVDQSHAEGFDDLWISHAALSRLPEHGGKFRSAVEAGMQAARRLGMGFGEVGGWAVAEAQRRTVEPLRIVLAKYGLMRLLGGALGLTAATYRHESAPILRRIGLSSLVAGDEELPPYYDPQYGCQMEVLQFDSRAPAPKYEDSVRELAADLMLAPVVCRERPETARRSLWAGFDPAPEPVLAPSW